MKKKPLLLVVTALFILPAGGALAEEDTGFTSSIEAGYFFNDSEDQSAKFLEYQDPESGVISNLQMDYYRDALFFGAEAENIGRDDQSYSLKGGRYNTLKFSLFYDEFPHNLSFGAKTFYSGLGTNMLNVSANPADESTWRTFDYTIDTTNYGGDIELFTGSPFFLQIGVDRQEKDGLKPLASGGFGGAVEFPEPVDYTTDNITIAGGYRSAEMSFKLSGTYSSFSNENDFLEWENPFAATDYNSLPQDNDYGTIGASFTWRQLPMMSTWTVRASYSNLSNDFSVYDYGAGIPPGLNQTTFEGDVSTTRFSTALTSYPMEKLDTRLFFDYYDRNNDSTVIVYTGGGNATHLFDYSKYSLGFDAGYKLTPHNKLSGGYSFEYINRDNRPDADSNMDNQAFLKLKNTSLDFMTAQFEYTFLIRDSDEDFDLTGLTPVDAEYIVQFVQRYDANSKTKHSLGFGLEFYPLDDLDLGVEYTFVRNNYDDVVLGRTEDTGHELYFDFTWRAAQFLTLSGFAGYEKYEAGSNHYNYSPGQSADPTVDDGNPATYRWSQSIEENYWTTGLSAKVPLMRDRLLLDFSVQYQESDGLSDFTTQGVTPLDQIDDYEDYYITTFEAKASYAVTEALDIGVGYLYERSNYDDLQYENYEYSQGTMYLTGAYADSNYEAHVGYFTVKYTF